MIKKAAIKVSLLVILAVVSSIVIYNYFDKNKTNEPTITEDETKFKNEYESLNGKQNASGKEHPKVDIVEDNGIVYASYNEIKEVITKGTGVIYFGFPECPWCRNAVPMLLQAANNTGLDKIYYFNAKEIRDTKELDENGNIVTTKEGTKEYYELVELLSTVLGEYEGLNDESIKRLYFPTVVFIKDGKIVGCHIDTLPSQTDPRVPLTEEQKAELINIYTDNIIKTLDSVCDDKC